jgi:hypothetical protein
VAYSKQTWIDGEAGGTSIDADRLGHLEDGVAAAATTSDAAATAIAGLGTASAANTGTASGNVPLLGTGGRLALARIASGTPDGTKFVADDGTLKTPAGGGTITSASITDATATGIAVLTAVSQAAGRTAIGAGTSSLALGTTSSTAKAGDYAPASTNISDATTVGKALIVAASQAAAQTALGLGTAAVISSSAGGDLSGTLPSPTVAKINGTSLAGLATGLLKNTTSTGVPSIAVAGTDYQAPLTIVTATAAKTFALTDANTFQRHNNTTGAAYTIPPNSSVAFVIGTQIHCQQVGTGQLSFVAGAGVTIQNAVGLKIAAQYQGASLVKVATDTWALIGALAA